MNKARQLPLSVNAESRLTVSSVYMNVYRVSSKDSR